MESKYRLVEHVYYNEVGYKYFPKYTIQERKSFLGIKYWSTIEKPFYDTYEPIEFNSVKEAEKFIKEKLYTNTPLDKFVSQVIKEYGK